MALQLPHCKPQDQRSVTDQLRTLVVIANREGLYDAADLIQEGLLKPRDARLTTAEILRDLSDGMTLTDSVSATIATPPSDGKEKG